MTEGNKNGSVHLTPAYDIVADKAFLLRTEIKQFIENTDEHLIIDLVHVEMVDSAGLSVFIATHNSLKQHGRVLRLINVSENVSRLLNLTRLDRHFTVEPRGNE
jgi:anti-anti-sigma factor